MPYEKQGPWPLDRRRDMFGKWDFIRAFFMDPCDAPWTAYALAMGGASLEAFVLLNQFDYGDIFWKSMQTGTGIMRFRSQRKGIRGKKSDRFKVFKKFGKVATFDPHEQIGRYIGRFSPLSKVKMPGPIGALWLLFNVLELLNFIIFLAEVITQWFFRWTSLLMESKYCAARDDAVFLGFTDYYTTAALFFETPLIINEVLKQRGPITRTGSTFTFPKGWSGTISASFAWEPSPDVPPSFLRLFIRSPQWHDGYVSQTYEPSPSGENTGGIQWDVSDGGTYTLTTFIDRGFAYLSDVTVYAQGSTK